MARCRWSRLSIALGKPIQLTVIWRTAKKRDEFTPYLILREIDSKILRPIATRRIAARKTVSLESAEQAARMGINAQLSKLGISHEPATPIEVMLLRRHLRIIGQRSPKASLLKANDALALFPLYLKEHEAKILTDAIRSLDCCSPTFCYFNPKPERKSDTEEVKAPKKQTKKKNKGKGIKRKKEAEEKGGWADFPPGIFRPEEERPFPLSYRQFELDLRSTVKYKTGHYKDIFPHQKRVKMR